MDKSLWTYTFGCKVNQFDTSAMELAVSSGGDWKINDRSKSPDAVIINTCTVTASADRQARQLARSIARKHPTAKVVVTGCYAESAPQDFSKIEGVSEVVPIRQQHQIPGMVGVTTSERKNLVELPTVLRRTRAFLKMQDGCNAYCSFCVLPYVRGRSKSIELKDLVDLAKSFEASGYLEVVITGTHIGAYGRDLKPRVRLSDAIKEILRQTQKIKLRVSSLEPTTLTPDLIKLVSNEDRILPHFHIPMQSGSDTVLRRMNRKNTVQNYVDRVVKLTQTRSKFGLGADVIVGFCGESEAEFEETRKIVEQLPFTYLHVFPYSGRPGTRANQFEDNVPTEEKKRRVGILRSIAKQKSKAFFQDFMGQTVPVLLEKKRDSLGFILGHTETYVPVAVEGPDRLMEMKLDVKIDSIEETADKQSYLMRGSLC